jgi:hypothetical protein
MRLREISGECFLIVISDQKIFLFWSSFQDSQSVAIYLGWQLDP